MDHSKQRRDFMLSAMALGCALAAPPAQAAAGKVLFGFSLNPAITPVMTGLLKEMQGRYQPDLGLKVTPMPGNSGALAVEAVHKAAADGGTVLLAPSSMLTLLPHLRTLSSVDPVKDLVPVAAIAQFTAAFVIGPAVSESVRGLKDYIRWVQNNPTQATYAVPSLGTAPHFVGMALARAADLPLKPVAYKGVQGAADDVQGGAVPAALMPLSVALHIAVHGKVRLLAVTSEQRWPTHPELPTMLELGVSDVTMVETFGLFVSARTPPANVQALGEAVRRAAGSDEVHAALARAGMLASVVIAEDYAAALAQERARWGQIVTKHRFSLQS